MTLHLLRGFVQWERDGEPIKTIPEARWSASRISASSASTPGRRDLRRAPPS